MICPLWAAEYPNPRQGRSNRLGDFSRRKVHDYVHCGVDGKFLIEDVGVSSGSSFRRRGGVRKLVTRRRNVKGNFNKRRSI